MAFNPQQISPIDFNKSAAVGVDIPFNGNAVFKSNFQTKDAIKNNLINFFLTNPGERVMVPDFGVGIRHMLFEQAGTRIGERIQERVFSQVREFMPHITIYNVDVSMGDDILSEAHSMLVRINYSIPSLEIMDQLTFDLTSVELG